MTGVRHGVVNDVGDMDVAQRVGDLPTAPLRLHQVAGAQYAQVLRDQGLGHAEGVDQLVDAAGPAVELADDRQTVRAGKGAQQFRRVLQGRFGRSGRSHGSHSRMRMYA